MGGRNKNGIHSVLRQKSPQSHQVRQHTTTTEIGIAKALDAMAEAVGECHKQTVVRHAVIVQ